MSSAPEPDPPRSPEEFRQLLQEAAPSFGVPLPDPTGTSLAVYLAELDSWRRRVNLTGRLSPRELAAHALESVLGASLIAGGAKVVDVGSGAGFPGLPIAIAREDLRVTLVEPRQKRCAFLRHVVRTLSLPHVAVAEARIEDLGGQTFDVATTRAVGRFRDWLSGASFLGGSGLVLAWTTETEDIERALGTGFRLERVIVIPGSTNRKIAAFRPVS
jgi:16S rRNA (guanine527-N7)-methyltransferase